MKEIHFMSLSFNAKLQLTIGYGEIINEVEDNNSYISLFLINNLFVEIYLDKQTEKIRSISLQNEADQLYKYVEELDIKSLTR